MRKPKKQKLKIIPFKKMDYFKWLEKFKPIKNHIDPEASSDGLLFETYGEDVQFVCDTTNGKVGKPHTVWTWMDGDNSDVICEGYHLCNRIGYYITEIPYDPNIQYNIK
jgi:hypothetical protein